MYESDLDVESSSTEFTAALVVELHPSGVLVKARTFPLQAAIGGRGGANECGEEIQRAAEGVEDGPGELPRQKWKEVLRLEWQLNGLREAD